MPDPNTRDLNLDPSADPRAEWPTLAAFDTYPTAWELDGDEQPREVRVVGRLGRTVLTVRPSRFGADDKDEHRKWHVVLRSETEVYTDPDTARLHGLASIQTRLAQLGDQLEKVAESAGVVLARKK